MPAITTCLWFDTEGEEAAAFYATVFPNSHVGAVALYGPGSGDREGTALTVDFSLDGQAFVALNGGPQFPHSEAVSFQIACATEQDVDHYWTALAKGGQHSQCGWLTDRFGVSWQVIPDRFRELMADPDPAVVQRVMGAMMTMSKLDVPALEKAAAGG